jgi:hypothetical protein
MTAIEASSVRVSTLADGTLRLIVDIEPRHANEAFALFGAPGVSMALARLATPTEKKSQERAEKPLGGPLSQWVAMRCAEQKFQEWLGAATTEAAAAEVRRLLDIESRAEIDNDPTVQVRFEEVIRLPWMRFNRVTT